MTKPVYRYLFRMRGVQLVLPRLEELVAAIYYCRDPVFSRDIEVHLQGGGSYDD